MQKSIQDVCKSVEPFDREPIQREFLQWYDMQSGTGRWFEPHVVVGSVRAQSSEIHALFEALEQVGHLLPRWKVYCRRCRDNPPIAFWKAPDQEKTVFCEDCCTWDDDDDRLREGQFSTWKCWIERPARKIKLSHSGVFWVLGSDNTSIPFDEIDELIRTAKYAQGQDGNCYDLENPWDVKGASRSRFGTDDQSIVLETAMWIAEQLNAELVIE